MLRSKKFKLVVSSTFVFIFLCFSLTYVFLQRREESIKGLSTVEDESHMSSGGIPFIVSLPPLSVVEGEEYVYVPLLSDLDTPIADLELTLVESPNWLFLEDGYVRGIAPLEGSSETYKFVLRVSDGYNSSSQENYIVVLDR